MATDDGRNDSITARCCCDEAWAVKMNRRNLFTGSIKTCLSGSATTPNRKIKAFKPDTTGQFQLIDIVWNSALKSIHVKSAVAEAEAESSSNNQVWNVEAHLMLGVKNVLYVDQKLSSEFDGEYDFIKPLTPHLIRFYIPPSASTKKVIGILRANLTPTGPLLSDLKFGDRDLAGLANVFETRMRDGSGDNSNVFVASFLTSYVFLVIKSGSRYGIQKSTKITDLSVLKFTNTRDKITTCAICLDDLKNRGNKVSTTCKHRFHHLCLKSWLQKKNGNGCPICRTIFSKEYLKLV